ncbi:MAG: TonB-dependent receptor [Bacteroidales bacterium]|jgi:outer membrane receptor protein involved in Fe transport|nr:TonB-dependent receptor [Bacteroidales bacterium]
MKLYSALTSFLLIISFLFSFKVMAQEGGGRADGGQRQPLPAGNGGIAGMITDAYGNPIQYATVFVMKMADSNTVEMNITGEDGKFRIAPVPFGDYFLRINSMGYATHNTAAFNLSEKKPFYRPGTFALSQKSTSLDAIEITAQRDMIQTNLDKRVYNVESNIAAEGASAVEILQDIPSVSVDMEGNVSLRGSENVTILVDGRPSNLTLEQIPASQIETIEVITNPSARLEPDGMAGILNVVLKKKKESGFNGLVTLGISPSYLPKKTSFNEHYVFLNGYNGNINLNYSYNKINVFLNYSYRHFGRQGAGDMERTSWFAGRDSSFLKQNSEQVNNGQSHNVRAGLDWFINKSNTLNFAFGYDYFGMEGQNLLNSSTSRFAGGETIPYQIFEQHGNQVNDGHNFNGNISYLKKFKTKGQELSADAYFSQRNGSRENSYSQLYAYPIDRNDYFQNTKTKEISRNASVQVDFVTPVGNGGRIETGFKYSLRTVGQDYALKDGLHEDSLFIDYSQSNNFNFTEHIGALYFIYSNTFWEKFKMQLGLRGEISQTISDLKSAGTVIKPQPLVRPFPTVHLRYDFNESHSLQLSYSMRVSRPRIWNLNPFVDMSDKLNWSTGNPYLQPEFVHSLELGYLMVINKSTFNATVFYRYRYHIVSRYTELRSGTDENGDSYTYTLNSFQNLNNGQNFGFELMYGQQFWKFWRMNVNADFYRVIINSDDLIDQNLSNDWAYGIRMSHAFTLPKDWDIQLNFRYRSPSITTGSMGFGGGGGGVGQGKRDGHYSLDLGVKKSFFKKNFVVSLNLRNLIYRWNSEIKTWSYEQKNGYDAISHRISSGFQANLSFTYRINKYQRRVEKHSDDENRSIEE